MRHISLKALWKYICDWQGTETALGICLAVFGDAGVFNVTPSITLTEEFLYAAVYVIGNLILNHSKASWKSTCDASQALK